MNSKRMLTIGAGVLLAALAAAALSGRWPEWMAFLGDLAVHRHRLVEMRDATGAVYYTCPMHPQVRQDQPGNCPICGMKLVRRMHQRTGAEPGGMAARDVLYWYDPMRPDVHFEQPGKSPFMDMDLVPKYGDGTPSGASAATRVDIDPRMVQNLGMRTAEVRRGVFEQRVDAVGVVAVDERRIVSIEARAAGWVERLDVRAVGDPVRRGQVVAAVYAPDLLTAREELALARRLGDTRLVEAARTRLKLLGVNDAGAEAPGPQVPVIAPHAGFVTELMVREGAQVAPGAPLMKVADLSRVWIIVEVPEAQAAWIAAGQRATARFPALAGSDFEGSVDYVYPVLDSATRTLRARLVFDNPEGVFKPGMYADVAVLGDAQRAATLVPSEAVIRTGQRSVVIVADAEGRYRPVEIRSGAERDGETIVIDGLDPGQRVVVSGQFLIDSEASLLGAYQRMDRARDPGQSPAATMRNMGGEASPGAYEVTRSAGARP